MEKKSLVKHAFPWGTIEWLAGGEVGNSRELSLARLVVDAGKSGDTHVHGNCEESIYVVRGEVECRIGAATETLGAGGHAVVPRGSVHSIRNRGASPAELVLGYSAAVREFALAQ